MVTLKATKEQGIYQRLGETKVSWLVRVDVDPYPDGRRRQTKRSFDSLDEARAYKVMVAHQRRTGSYVEPSRELLGSYLGRWCAAQRGRVRPSAILAYRQAFARWVSLHATPLAKLTETLIHRAEQAMLDGGYATGTVYGAHVALKYALADAVRHRLLRENPCQDVKPPKVTRKPTPMFDSAEVERFRAAIVDDPYRALWEVALETGMRVGEMRALRWSSVDLNAKTLDVVASVTKTEANRETEGPPKSESGVRTISLSWELVQVVREHRAVVRARQLFEPGWDAGDYVFPGEDGRCLSSIAIRTALFHACERAGVTRISVHGLRHSSGTLQVEAGIPIKTVAERMGHSKVAMTMDMYVHPDRVSHQRAAESISGVLRGRRVQNVSGARSGTGE